MPQKRAPWNTRFNQTKIIKENHQRLHAVSYLLKIENIFKTCPPTPDDFIFNNKAL